LNGVGICLVSSWS